MKIYPVEQGTDEWYALRLGRPTSSIMGQIVRPPDLRERYDCGNPNCKVNHTAENAAAKCKGGTGKPRKYLDTTVRPSESFEATANTLVAETLAGVPLESFESEWMQRGKEIQAEATVYYQLQHHADLQEVGFVGMDDDWAGCSPDGIRLDTTGDEIICLGGLELKCPSPAVHINYLLGGKCPNVYVPQVQACMYVCGCDTWDFMSYHPDLPTLVVTVPRDDTYIDGMAYHLALLKGEVADRLAHIRRTYG